MADKKMTKKDYFAQIKAKYALSEDEVAFIDHEIELLDKKNASRKDGKTLTKTQKENEVIKEAILNAMEPNKSYTITEMLKTFDCFDETMTNQKLSALVRQLKDGDNPSVIRTEIKGKAYFSKVVL